MPFKDISYLELWQPLCSEDRNNLCNFGRRHHEIQFCEIIFKFGPVVQEEMQSCILNIERLSCLARDIDHQMTSDVNKWRDTTQSLLPSSVLLTFLYAKHVKQ